MPRHQFLTIDRDVLKELLKLSIIQALILNYYRNKTKGINEKSIDLLKLKVHGGAWN